MLCGQSVFAAILVASLMANSECTSLLTCQTDIAQCISPIQPLLSDSTFDLWAAITAARAEFCSSYDSLLSTASSSYADISTCIDNLVVECNTFVSEVYGYQAYIHTMNDACQVSACSDIMTAIGAGTSCIEGTSLESLTQSNIDALTSNSAQCTDALTVDTCMSAIQTTCPFLIKLLADMKKDRSPPDNMAKLFDIPVGYSAISKCRDLMYGETCEASLIACVVPIMTLMTGTQYDDMDLATVMDTNQRDGICGLFADVDWDSAITCIDTASTSEACVQLPLADSDKVMYGVYVKAYRELCTDACSTSAMTPIMTSIDECVAANTNLQNANYPQVENPASSSVYCQEAATLAPCLEAVDTSCSFINHIVRDATGSGAPLGAGNIAVMLNVHPGMWAIGSCDVVFAAPSEDSGTSPIQSSIFVIILHLAYVLCLN